ncbi:MAG: hypothetical protein QXQ02_09960 [Halobacteria archaeon]
MRGQGKTLEIGRLKTFVKRLPDCALRTVLLAEDDNVDVTRFLALLPLWLRLARLLEDERNGPNATRR